MTKLYTIWTNYDLDYDRDWKADLEAEYPDLTDDQRVDMMYQINNEYLDDERTNLNIHVGSPILVIADLGLWNGRRSGYREIKSGKISDCLYSGRDDMYVTWFVDELGDLCCQAIHHDGTNWYTYRAYKDGVTDRQIDFLHEKIYSGTATRKDITRITRRLGDDIAEVYGWKLKGRRAA